jgi:hypothetical protein
LINSIISTGERFRFFLRKIMARAGDDMMGAPWFGRLGNSIAATPDMAEILDGNSREW